MAGVGADALVSPLHDLLGAFGTDVPPSSDPGNGLRAGCAMAEEAHATCRSALAELSWGWTGAAAEAALDSGERILADTLGAVDRGIELATSVLDATVTVVTGAAELKRIIDSFVVLAQNAAPALALPQGQLMLITAAIEHISEGLDVLTRVVAALSELTATVTASIPAPPAGAPIPNEDGTVPAAPGNLPTGSGEISTMGGSAPATGGGVAVTLPDGTVAHAPNPTAAEAVRRALDQQGTPYVWGGTTPGRGLDCSGLTQWAYGQAGLEIPRLAQEQDVGTPVDSGSVLPGDLAVWDGHVAMVVGGGMMVEAGDPVAVTPIRTTNSGMSFQGFYRPTE
ncbi:C40 family peptidase [Rhodococcus artemisiae]|uniref:C40 family peptidase n=1 Tax=Rhodococcus artemisiae TaxID=714159 RepID=A0ABU7L7C1_9NOCA|nr:C40 family peptidase [Rhodococcus artemisiae]MEE2057444.1 C40 family peptidase [Rhodococcus artemisiae]